MQGHSRADFEDVWTRLLAQRGHIGELRRLFERTPIPMTWLDDDQRRLDSNPAARLFLRQTLAEIQGQSTADSVPLERRAEADRQWARLLEEGSVAGTIPVTFPDGQTVEVDYCGVAHLLPGAHLFVWMPSDWSDDELTPSAEADQTPKSGHRLTEREREVLSLLATGATLEEIAGQLSVAPSTVKTHLRNALLRLGARHRAHALAIAIRDGEIDLD